MSNKKQAQLGYPEDYGPPGLLRHLLKDDFANACANLNRVLVVVVNVL